MRSLVLYFEGLFTVMICRVPFPLVSREAWACKPWIFLFPFLMIWLTSHHLVNDLPVCAGRKSYIRTPTKLASSVAYPFAFIKPCGFHGDVTLKDINQRIRTPPPSKLKHHPEDPSQSYPTSAFSGKPVVGKTKIHTEGGKGSITIMRTRGWTRNG